jgi:hypothetical protein
MYTVPPTSGLYSKQQIVERHPHLFTPSRVEWAVRHRHNNGLENVVYESRSGESRQGSTDPRRTRQRDGCRRGPTNH